MNKNKCIREMYLILDEFRNMSRREISDIYRTPTICGQGQWAGRHIAFKKISLILDEYSYEIAEAFNNQ